MHSVSTERLDFFGHVTEILQSFEKFPDLSAMIQQMQPLKQSVLSPVQFSDKDLRTDLPILQFAVRDQDSAYSRGCNFISWMRSSIGTPPG